MTSLLTKYPSIDFLRECFREDSGRLFWLFRPRSHFKSDMVWRCWNSRHANKEAGGLTKYKGTRPSRWVIGINNKLIYRYLIVWALQHGEWKLKLDHKDRNPLHDWIGNLRPSTQSQNLANANLRSDNTSGMKGVAWRKDRHKWAAGIRVNKKTIHLGLFDDVAMAQRAYANAASQHYGEFACIGDRTRRDQHPVGC